MRSGHPLALFTLAGDEATMGAQHGELTRSLGGYDELLAFYPSLPDRILSGGHRAPARRLVVGALKSLLARGVARLDRARPEALRQRTRAFLAALGRPEPERDARLLTLLDGIQNAVGMLAKLGVASERRAREIGQALPGACSSFAVWDESSHDGSLLHGRNFDLPGIGVWERQPTVVFCAPADGGLRYGFVSTRGADVPGVTAFNEAGLTVSAHTRFHRAVTFDGRGVVDLGHLIAARARTITDAIAIAGEQRVASSWGMFVSSASERRAVVIEVHADRVAVVPPASGQTWHTCANRYRAPLMQLGEFTPSPAWARYSEGRQASMERALGRDRRITPAQAMALLGNREAGDVPGWQRATGDTLCQSITIQSVVVDADHGRLWLGVGDCPASLGPWIEVPWRWDGPGVQVVEATNDHVGPAWPGFERFMEAARLEGERTSIDDVERVLAEALAAAPDDPSYRHLMGGCALRGGRPDEAAHHFEVALAHERSAFRRGELERWLVDARRAERRRSRARRDLAVDFQLLTLS